MQERPRDEKVSKLLIGSTIGAINRVYRAPREEALRRALHETSGSTP